MSDEMSQFLTAWFAVHGAVIALLVALRVFRRFTGE